MGTAFVARYTDGRSAESTEVRVRLGERGIEIESPEPAVALVWPYGTLATSDPSTEYDIDALVTYKHWPGATLFVPDETFARRLAKEAPTIN